MIQSNQAINRTASEWAVRLHGRALSTEEQVELGLWLNADTRHRGALLRARAMWSDLDRLAALAGHPKAPGSHLRGDGTASFASSQAQPPVEARGPQALENPFPSHLHSTAPPMHRGVEESAKSTEHGGGASLYPFNNRRRLFVAGVTAALFGSAGAWWFERRPATYVSKVGEIRRVTLPDGSRMVLNTSTEAIVRFDKTRREIELAAGEGLFEVTKDPLRPFIVRAGSVSVHAIGTVFAVRSGDQRVDVTVTEGIVELVDNGTSRNAVIRRVVANEHATIMETSEVQVQSMPRVEAERRLAWREGMVDFAGESLDTAVQEINRHNHRQIVIDDAALASRPVVGVFRADDPDGFAATVATALGAHSAALDDGIHLRLRSAL
jgi:transmembrane sensor